MSNISGIFSYLTSLSSAQGYQTLSANLQQSVQNFTKESGVNTDIAAFEKGVSQTKTVNDFVSNPKLVNFVLTAFGLDSVSNEQGLLQKVLTQDPNNANSLVNQLSDPRFKQLATALDFYDYGLGKVQGVGQPVPTSASQAEGITLPSATGSKAAATTPGISFGIAIGGGGYLQLQKTDGTTVYAKSAYFTVDKNNHLSLPDGTTLKPSFVIPTGATGVTTDTQGDIYAQVGGKSQLVGQIQLATFGNTGALKTDPKTGYITASAAAGTIKTGIATDTSIGLGSTHAYTNTFQDLANYYTTNEFEESVGDSNSAVREALYFNRNIKADTSNTGKSGALNNAYAVLGDNVIRDVFLTGIGQPASIAEQSLTTQVSIAETGLNDVNFQDKSQVSNFVQRYLSTIDATGASTTTASAASQSPAAQILTAFASSSSSSSSIGSIGSAILSLVV